MKTTIILALALQSVCLAGHARGASFQTNQPADLVLGQPDFESSDNDAAADRFDAPVGVAYDPATGKVFISDFYNNRVLRFSSVAAAKSGAPAEMVFGQKHLVAAGQPNQGGNASASTLSSPCGIAVDAKGRLWVADSGNNRVVGFYFASSFLFAEGTSPDASIVLGQPDAKSTATSSGAPYDRMNAPSGVSVGPDDTLWIADRGANRVLRYADISAKATGAPFDGLLGQYGTFSIDPSFGDTGMTSPTDVYADAALRLWVTDYGNRRVLRYDDAAKTAGPVAIGHPDGVLGQTGLYQSDPATYDDAHVNLCNGVYLDATGTLWVSDYLGHRVLGFPRAATLGNGASATIVLGQADLGQSKQPAKASERNFLVAKQICGGPGGSLLIADSALNRVLRFSPLNIVPPPIAKPSVKISGAKNVTTAKAKLTIKGKATGQVTSVTAKIDKKTVKARGTASWSLKVALKPGKKPDHRDRPRPRRRQRAEQTHHHPQKIARHENAVSSSRRHTSAARRASRLWQGLAGAAPGRSAPPPPARPLPHLSLRLRNLLRENRRRQRKVDLPLL